MPDLSTPQAIQAALRRSLDQLGTIQECVLLNYPDYPNIGDHLIGLGTLVYLLHHCQAKVNYLAGLQNFRAEQLQERIGQGIIILQGGGNLGDLWYEHQSFREEIISQYHNRRIIIMPQTIHFQSQARLDHTAQVFNAHPDLTILVRDRHSESLARNHFNQCRIIPAPDMAFWLVDLPWLPWFQLNFQQYGHPLYHCRKDAEMPPLFQPENLPLRKMTVADWLPPAQWLERQMITPDSPWYWQLPGVVRLYRELWQKRLSQTTAWLAYHPWHYWHPYNKLWQALPEPLMARESWHYCYQGIYQFNRYPCVITNRLHGHILCVLLGIPHVFLPNSYGKNQLWYETWTSQIANVRFVTSPEEVRPALEAIWSHGTY